MENNDIDNNDSDDILAKNDSELLIINNIISDYDTQSHFTSNILTKYEKVMIIIERTQQIMQGANPLIDNFKNFNNIEDIVYEELKQKKLPFIIKRNIANKFDYWKLEDLTIY